MPNQTCTKCGAIFVLPYVRSRDHAEVRMKCPWCNTNYIESRTGPNCPTYGPIQLAQMQVEKENEPGVGALIKAPTDGTGRHSARMSEVEREAFHKANGPKGNQIESHKTKPPA